MVDRSHKHEERHAGGRARKKKPEIRKVIGQAKVRRSASSTETSPEELEASAIFERVERALADIEARTERLMHQYGL